MSQLFAKLEGYKTYLVCAIAVLTALLSYLNHQISLIDLAMAVLAALGAASGRQAITTSTNRVINATQAAVAAAAQPPPGSVPQSQGQPRDPNDLG